MAQVDSPEFIDSALQVYHTEVRRSIKAQDERLQQLQTAQDQLQQTIATVQDLPTKLRHQVMVPFGKHAFFPGQLTHTNEFVVHLGDQYYVETTAAAAQGILQRKLAVITDGLQKAQKQLQALQARLDITQSTLNADSSADNAVEIRSTVEESDAILAAARGTRDGHSQGRTTAAGGMKQQFKQRPVGRVKAAAGYSYTPLGPTAISDNSSEQQQQQQQQSGLDPDDLALQARLEELIRLEEQQEVDELEQHHYHHHQQQQQQWQQQWQPGGLTSIQEGDEEQEEAPATAAGPSRRGAAERLQQLEAEADSDDEEEQQQQQQGHQHQAQHQHQQPSAAALGPIAEHQTSISGHSHQQQLHQQQHQHTTAAIKSVCYQPTASSAAVPGRKPLKSALKKGFLASSAPRAQSLKAANRDNSAEAAASQPRSASSQAFTGSVVERPSPAQPVVAEVVKPPQAGVFPAVGAVVEQPVAASSRASSSAADSTSGPSKISKFKLRRMGLEPPVE